MPAPVIVMKDVGGFVADYQAQTELYRASDREVRLHECRSACTMALSLPNVCVYPDSTLKFHLAYDVRNRQTDATISQQLFDSYPAAVRTRLGGLTRQYKVLRGSELIALGVRDCGERRVMVAAGESRKRAARPEAPASAPAAQGSLLAGLMRNVASVFGGRGEQGRDKGLLARSAPVAKPAQEAAAATPPLPPARPIEVAESSAAASELAAKETMQEGAEDAAAAAAEQMLADAPAPPRRPVRLAFSYQHRQTPVALPQIIIGAQPILPPGFRAFAEFER
jgi:hypothetical protein